MDLSDHQVNLVGILMDSRHYERQTGLRFSKVEVAVTHYLRSVGGVSPSPSFDAERYAERHFELDGSGIDPFLHYLFDTVGERLLNETVAVLSAPLVERLRAHFDAKWYLGRYRDVFDAAHDPFIHYLTTGAREEREPSADFVPAAYLELYPDVRNSGMLAFHHWVFHGQAEGRSNGAASSTLPHLNDLSASRALILDRMFALDYFRSAATTDAAREMTVAQQIVSAQPTPSFNVAAYLATRPEAREVGRLPFLHYLFDTVGESALRELFVQQSLPTLEAACAHFDTAWYLYANPDVESLGVDAFIHYLTTGWREGRDPSRNFATRAYLRRYPDIVEAGVNPFLHWVTFGIAEGRVGQSVASNFRNRCYRPSITAILINDAVRPLTAKTLAAVLRQSYEQLQIVIVGEPVSETCRPVLVSERCVREIAVPSADSSCSQVSLGMLGSVVDDLGGDILWFVPGDTVPDFQCLARLTSSFADGSVQMAFGRHLGPDDAEYATDEDALARQMEGWSRHATTPAASWFPEQLRPERLASRPLGFAWRRRRLGQRIWNEADGYRRLGWWSLFLHMASGGQIADVRDAVFRLPASEETSSQLLREECFLKEVTRFSTLVNQFWPASKVEGASRHILIATHGIFAGGAENLPIHLANALVARGLVVSLLIFKAELNAAMVATLDPGVSIYEADWVLEYGCPRFLRDSGCSLVHSHGVIGEMFFFRVCDEPLSRPYVATLHGSYEASTSVELPEWLIARIVRKVDLFVYTADKNLVPLVRNGVRPAQLIKMINAMPIDPAPFPRSRAELGIDADAIIFTLVARGIPEKGWVTAIAAFKAVQARHPHQPLHLCLVGEGEEPDRLRSLHAGNRSISFLGFQLRIHGLYAITDVAIVPTRFSGESFPLCIIQALQVGTPVIATDVGEIASMLERDGVRGGLLVEASTVDAEFDDGFTSAMDSIVNDAVRERLASGAALLGQRYNMDTFTDQYVSLYEDVIRRFEASRATRPPPGPLLCDADAA